MQCQIKCFGPNGFLFRFAVRRHVNATWSVYCDRQYSRIPTMCKNSSPILSRLWTKVYEILELCSEPFIVSAATSPIVYITFDSDGICR